MSLAASPSDPPVQGSHFPLVGLFFNSCLWAALLSFLCAQVSKFALEYIYTEKLDWTRLWGSGGLPSSHTAFVTGLAASICMREGSDSPLFALAFVLAAIVAYDATGVRQHAGRQASVVNAMVLHLPPEHPIQEHEHAGRLKDQLGHTPLEVAVGAVVGTLVGLLVEVIALR